LREEYDITVVSLSVNFGEETVKEENIEHHTFYEKLKLSPVLPTSSQPAVRDMFEAFERHVKEGHAVVGIFLSSEMSGTYANAMMVRNMLLEIYPEAKIEILDSRSNCMELGFAALAAAKSAKKGESFEQVVQAAKYVMERSRFLFAPATLEYLRKGGRIGGASALIGSLLQIKPILTVVDGKTAVQTKVRTLEKAIQKIVETCLEDIREFGLEDITVHHIDDETMGKKLVKMLEQALGRMVPLYSIGPVIGAHVGPGTTGIVYYTKEVPIR
jgi:DegV family protein with EDD domain